MAISLASLIVKLEADTTNFRTGIGTAGKVLGGLVGIVGAFGALSLRAAANIESQRIALKNLTGSAEEANKIFTEIQQFAAKTPFETDEILKSTTAIIGFGVSSKQALTDVKNLAAAAASSSSADLNKIAVNFGQVSAAGKATARDLREFVNQGINIYGVLADSLGVSVAAVQELQSQGKITGAVLSKAFQDAVGPSGRFRDTLIDQSQSLQGLYSTFKSQVNIVLGNFGATLLPAAKEAVKGFITILDDLIPKMNEAFGDDFAVSFAAGVRAAFESASTEAQILYNKMKGFFLLIANEFFELAAKLANSSIGGLIFSDEDIRNSNLNLLEVKSKLLGVQSTVEALQATGNTFGERYKIAFAEISEAIAKAGGSLGGFKDQLDDAGAAGEEAANVLDKLRNKYLKLIDINIGDAIASDPGSAPGSPAVRDFSPQQGLAALPDLESDVPEILGISIERMKELRDAAESFGESFSSAFYQAIVQAKSFNDVWKNVGQALVGIFRQIVAEMIKIIIKTLILKAITAAISGGTAPVEGVGGEGGAGGLLGALGKLFGSANKSGKVGVEVTGAISGSVINLAGNRAANITGRGG